MLKITQTFQKKYDIYLIFCVAVLAIIGYLTLLSLTATRPYRFFIKQFLFILPGIITMLALLSVNYRKIQKYRSFSIVFVLFSFLSLIAVLIFGQENLGAKRWINLGFFSFQPSEFAKIAIVVYLADFIARKKENIDDLSSLVAPALIFSLIATPIFFESDKGTVFLIAAVCLAMLFCAGARISYLLLGAMSLLTVLSTIIMMSGYSRSRVVNYFKSIFDINEILINKDGNYYQVKQSISALGSGGITGKGLGSGELKLGYLTQSENDFIFSVVGEEIGLFGTCAVAAIFLYIFLRCLKMSESMPDDFLRYLCLGLSFTIVFQAFINMSVATALIPTKGITLPFISYGGSSLFANMIMAAVLINLSQYGKTK
ncbi:MAG: putative lipid II flippase FtsW [Elusimicrobiota bacterium]|jgi:cell division protein FtsW|nr:putative lipid II flippase FtsW [Elusimicrobiota bacterium]